MQRRPFGVLGQDQQYGTSRDAVGALGTMTDTPRHKRLSMRVVYVVVAVAVVVCGGVIYHTTTATSKGVGGPQVQLSQGRLLGLEQQTEDGKPFYAFRGVPYAKPPIGELRLKDPEPAEPWDGLKNSSSWPPRCAQVLFVNQRDGKKIVTGLEDCLYLNIFTPHLHGNGDNLLPVMVFFHGGAFLAGRSAAFLPHPLVSQNIVLITVQYRLGVLGFLSTEDSVMPGNLGLKDQTLALRWVNENIIPFGGDPNKVTIFGSSAGSASANLHMMNPHAQGLFSSVILQSGAALCPWVLRRNHKDIATEIGVLMNCTHQDAKFATPEAESEDLLHCLQGVPVEDLVPSYMPFSEWWTLPWEPVPRVDGDYLPKDPEVLLKEGLYHRVPIITGVVKHEGDLATKGIYKHPGVREQLEQEFTKVGPWAAMLFQDGDDWPLLLTRLAFKYYVGGVDLSDSNEPKVTQLFSDRHFKIPHDDTWQLMASHQKDDHKVFAYEFEYRGNFHTPDNESSIGNDWVGHHEELYYLFNFASVPKLEGDDVSVRETFLKLWTNFATTGNPTPDDSLGFKWLAVNSSHPEHLLIDLNSTMREHQRNNEGAFWSSLPTKKNKFLYPDRVAAFNAFFKDVDKNTVDPPEWRPQPPPGPSSSTPV